VGGADATPSRGSDAWAIPAGDGAATRYAALLDIAFDLSCLIDSGGHVSYASPSVQRLLGYSPDEIASVDLYSCIHAEDEGELTRMVREVLDGRLPATGRVRVRRADGSYRTIEATAVNLLDDPAVSGIALAGRDVTGEQTARRLAQSVEDRLRVLVENSPVIVFSLDAEGVITSALGRELTDLGIDGEQLVGRSIFSFGEGARATSDAVRKSLAGEDVDITYEIGGRLFDLRYRPVREDGQVTGVLGIGTDISESIRAMQQVTASEARWRSVVSESADAAVIVDAAAVVRFLSPAATTLFGWQPEDVLGQSAFDFVHPDDLPTIQQNFDVVLRDPSVHRNVEFRLRTVDGSYRWTEVAMRNRLDDPAVAGLIGNIRDITERTESRGALAASEARYRLIVETTRDGIALIDADGTVTYANERLAELSGIALDRLLGSPLDSWIDARAIPLVDAARERRQAGKGGSYEIPFRHPDGQDRYLLINATPLPPPAPYRGFLVLISDITQRKRAERELARLALHDALTGLPNRALLLDRISGALTRRRRHGGLVALLLVDIDQFTSVNDSLGTAGGDDLLRQVPERLEGIVRAGDTVGRLGGDEFAVLTEELASEAEAALLADRLLAAIAEPVRLPGHDGPVEAVVTASIGVAVTASDVMRPEDLLQRGELAMHRAKVRGRARHEVLSDDGKLQSVDRLRVVNELRSGLRRGELELHYQPLVELSSGRIVGAEALARWRHPERGLLEPEEFIGLAEESGLIRELGAWVLRTACRQAARGGDEGISRGDPGFTIAVNLSTQQLADVGLSDLVAGVLKETALPPHRLMLEVTETALLADTAATLHELQSLRRLGVQLALDDFGTGFSSLTYLKRFPLHELKIDRSFVSELGIDPASDAIVASVIQLARAIGLSVVAEGVETEAQRHALLVLGCTLGQGFLFGRPVPAAEFPTSARVSSPTTGW
jgi:diguanylate cyclase (GGDEF)-like protein/PAS domain S-box-containing protein